MEFSKSKWIGTGACANNWKSPVLPAPYFRKELTLDKVPGQASVKICGLGYYELYINGKKVGDHVLDPIVTQYDQRARYVTYDVTAYLKAGVNTFGVILGNGWYYPHTKEVWHFDKASWRCYPKFLLDMEADGQSLLVSDQSWKCSTGPIIFDGLRNGETYDAHLELTGWLESGYDDSEWKNAAGVTPPGGILQEQTSPPCKVMQTLEVQKQWEVQDGTVYDLGQNIAGWARITVKGDSKAKITLRYAEKLDESKCIDQSNIDKFVEEGPEAFQTDRYILKGDGEETWEPRFTYHGFRWIQVRIEGNAEIVKLEGRVVYTAFDKIGSFECSDENVNKLQRCTEWSYIGNFVGIPTDCPHREKNGWTGDAQLAAETGLFNYDASKAYGQWLESIVDTQRPSGQLPGIVPTGGWGFNWGSGPAWDNVIFELPWNIYVFTGDDSEIRKNYDAMKKYVDYCTSMANDGIIGFGLGDWCHSDNYKIVDRDLTDTGYYYACATRLAKFAVLTGRSDDAASYTELAAQIKRAFNREFYRGNGIYAKGEPTAMGCALYHGLVEESEKAITLERLSETVKGNGNKPDFGILGAKYVPRVLAENGHVEQAYELITQPEYPGWVNWLKQGATTLWESWSGGASLNHIMFGDISAWFYQYLAGIVPDVDKPGFSKLTLKPQPVKALDHVKACCKLPSGELKVEWKNTAGKFMLDLETPVATILKMPDGSIKELAPGSYKEIC